MFPRLGALPTGCACKHDDTSTSPAGVDNPPNAMKWYSLKEVVQDNFLPLQSWSDDVPARLGCYPLGSLVSLEDFHEVVFSQVNLRKLELLDAVSASELRRYGEAFNSFITGCAAALEPTVAGTPSIKKLVRDLARTLQCAPDDGKDGIRVFRGLHSGFQRSPGQEFWAVYDTSPSTADVYISKNANDILGTLLHVYLSLRGLKRSQCFATETLFARWNSDLSPRMLPPRVIQDIDLLSPEDCLLLYQEISILLESHSDHFLSCVRTSLTERLLDIPTWNQLRHDSTVRYLAGDLTVGELLDSRLQWHCKNARPHPSLDEATLFFQELEEKLISALKERNSSVLHVIVDELRNILTDSKLSCAGDLFALSVFCVMRKIAFEEIYMEVTDRNPLFNDQPDQAAAFSELFALGSRCEAYFDVSPSKFGELIHKKFDSHYSASEHQPPMFEDTQGVMKSSYVEAQMDADTGFKPVQIPTYQHFSFLSVFAIPALIDILLLTTTGHGLYLSGHNFMSGTEMHSATTALLVALLISGFFGTWITCGGTYYIASMAFSAMNYFMITRLLGGFAFTLIVGLIGFVIFACSGSPYGGLIFFLYLVALASYFILLAALANYQLPGSAFLSVSTSFIRHSSRTDIILSVPIGLSKTRRSADLTYKTREEQLLSFVFQFCFYRQ